MWVPIALGIIAACVILVSTRQFLRARGTTEKAKADHLSTLIQAIGVAAALLAVAYQYVQSTTSAASQSRQAVTTMLMSSYDPAAVDNSYGALRSAQNLKRFDATAQSKFNDETGTLTSYFWAIDTCVRTGMCERKLALSTFCEDYRRYRATYELANGWKAVATSFGYMQELEHCPTPSVPE